MTLKRKHIIGFVFLFLVVFNCVFVSALSARIGNGRMILRVEPGQEIQKYVKVINSNNVSVKIDLIASGDLKDEIKLIDKSFVLKPDKEKKAYFTIKSDDEGTYESSINVGFAPVDGNGHGVGLSSTVILIVGDGKGSGDDGNVNHNEDKNESGVNVTPRKVIGDSSSKKVVSSKNVVMTGLVITSIIFLIFLVSLISYFKKVGNKKVVATKSKKKVQKK